MSADERILRLENAMATLAELGANQEQRAARLEESFAILARVAADQQRRAARLEEALVTLTELTHSHHDSIDELRAAQAEWGRWAAESERRIAALAESQEHSDRRLDAWIDIVRNQRGGGTGT